MIPVVLSTLLILGLCALLLWRAAGSLLRANQLLAAVDLGGTLGSSRELERAAEGLRSAVVEHRSGRDRPDTDPR